MQSLGFLRRQQPAGGFGHGHYSQASQEAMGLPQARVAQRTTQPATFSAHQANSLKVLTFAGQGFHLAPHLRLEQDFIRSLQDSKSTDEKSGVADILGRAQSINALPALQALTQDKETPEVRMSAICALGHIGDSTHPNSYTRQELTERLLALYTQRHQELLGRLSKSADGQAYKSLLEEKEHWEKLQKELKALILAISELNTPKGKKALQEAYRHTLDKATLSLKEKQALSKAIELAKEEMHRQLKKDYKKPVDDILKEIPAEELKKRKSETKVALPNGKTMTLLEAMELDGANADVEALDHALLLTLTEGLARHPDPDITATLKQGVDSPKAGLKARTLELLGGRQGVHYASDIYPNLSSRNKEVRQAALKALLASTEPAARQKTLELIKPKAFFEVVGTLGAEGIGSYVDFLTTLAEKGDQYINGLSKQALGPDYDQETRLLSLTTLGLMTRKPASQAISASTLKRAQSVIITLAKDAPAREPAEHDALTLNATRLWVEMKDPEAIPAAIMLADNKRHQIRIQDQEGLLSSVFQVLQKEADETPPARKAETGSRVLDTLKQGGSGLLSSEMERTIRAQWPKSREEKQLFPADSEAPEATTPPEKVDKSLEAKLKPSVESIRPFLKRLAENDKSLRSQMLASRILGLLKDEQSVDFLRERVRNPLKGQLDWNAERSYAGNPAMAGANVRLNALLALGQIGDSRAVDVMTDALDDPILRSFTLEPLGKIAKRVNEKADADTLTRVRGKLLEVMENENTGRPARAMRITAAKTLFQYKDGLDAIRTFIEQTLNPDFKRHAMAGLIANDYALDSTHSDHSIINALTRPELGVARLHEKRITGKGVEMAVIDGGYVDATNEEGFQKRVKLPPRADKPEHYHPTMVTSTAAANGHLKGVAPDALVYSDKWPDFGGSDPMDVYKRIIEGKLRGENNIRVINNSWGFSNQNVLLHKDVRQVLKEFKQVVNLAEKAGMQMVFAAGNEGEEPGFPKLGTLGLFGLDIDKLIANEDEKAEAKQDLDYILDKVILVGAVNTRGLSDRSKHKMAEFSSIGDSLNNRLTPTVVAPGADMMVYNWKPDNSQPKDLVNGTSFASPFVSGLLSLMFQVNSKLTPKQARDILKQTAFLLPGVPVSKQGAGEVSPEDAVNAAKALARPGKRKSAPETSAITTGQPHKKSRPSTPPPDAETNPTPPEASTSRIRFH